MPWIKVDTRFARHRKFAETGPLALAMQVGALCWAAENLTDGFIPTDAAYGLVFGVNGHTEATIAALVKVGLWEVTTGGWQIHDYADYQMTKAAVETARRQRSDAGQRSATKRSTVRQRGVQRKPNGTPTRPSTDVEILDVEIREADTRTNMKPSSETANAVSAPGANELVKIYTDACVAEGSTPTTRDKARVGKAARDLLAEKPYDLIATAAKRLAKRNGSPAHLERYVTDLERDLAHGSDQTFDEAWLEVQNAVRDGKGRGALTSQRAKIAWLEAFGAVGGQWVTLNRWAFWSAWQEAKA